MKLIEQKTIDMVVEEARVSSRKRKNFNYHVHLSDPINRMLNALEPGTYVQPHKHEDPDKREVFVILTGRMGVFIFDDHGNVIETAVLDRDAGVYGIEILPGTWHAVVSLAPGSVVYEVKDGPYEPLSDKNFAAWAPKEGAPEAAAYLASLEKLIG
ncbi:WbuC family cupin fold metalloprotein [Alkaliflexus imshenetskii]|uniref:WbuC family cupin fold metalloprotein n=1 Tax=Alkaliflexus imshenetskii TaxID=286730 RepID=UPI00047B7D1B|nr:WbuC family cupin fold metalloprotein [Alkaliflexus imshenetskii]